MNLIRKIVGYICLLLFLVLSAICIDLIFTDPELINTYLFNEYWWANLIFMILILGIEWGLNSLKTTPNELPGD